MTNYSKELFNQKLSEFQFPDYSSFENVNEAYADLSSKLIGYRQYCPSKTNMTKTNTNAWFDSEVLEKTSNQGQIKKKI